MRKIIASFVAIAFVCTLSMLTVGCGGNKANTASKGTEVKKETTTGPGGATTVKEERKETEKK